MESIRWSVLQGLRINELTKILKGTGLQAHHLLEKRVAKILGVDPMKMLSVAMTKAEHSAFTKAWRQAIGYVGQKKAITTANATKEQIFDAARSIYKDYPEIIKALGL